MINQCFNMLLEKFIATQDETMLASNCALAKQYGYCDCSQCHAEDFRICEDKITDFIFSEVSRCQKSA